MPNLNCPTCKGLGGYPNCPTCHNADPAKEKADDRLALTPCSASESDELSLAYMSIETMKTRIATLERENARLREDASKPHGPSPGWSGDDTEGYGNGFRGHGY